jgi:hypothetical protein
MVLSPTCCRQRAVANDSATAAAVAAPAATGVSSATAAAATTVTTQSRLGGQTSQFPTCSERERVIKSYDDYIDVTVLGATPHTLQLHVWRYPPHNGGPRARVSGWANSYRRRAAFGECLGFGSPPAPPAYGQCPAFGVRLRLMESRPYNWRGEGGGKSSSLSIT